MKELIHNIRFGNKDIRSLTDKELEALLGYNLSQDVFELCYIEIRRRRDIKLLELRK